MDMNFFFFGLPQPDLFLLYLVALFVLGELSPDSSLISTLSLVYSLNQDSLASNSTLCSNSALLIAVLLLFGDCISKGTRCINYAVHDSEPPLQSLVSPCL